MAKKTPQKKAKKSLFEAIGWVVWKIICFFPRLILKAVKAILNRVWMSLGRAGFPIARRQVQDNRTRSRTRR